MTYHPLLWHTQLACSTESSIGLMFVYETHIYISMFSVFLWTRSYFSTFLSNNSDAYFLGLTSNPIPHPSVHPLSHTPVHMMTFSFWNCFRTENVGRRGVEWNSRDVRASDPFIRRSRPAWFREMPYQAHSNLIDEPPSIASATGLDDSSPRCYDNFKDRLQAISSQDSLAIKYKRMKCAVIVMATLMIIASMLLVGVSLAMAEHIDELGRSLLRGVDFGGREKEFHLFWGIFMHF